ncbi:hypothetical protein FMM74_020655 [Lachnospiraceae bacterium MD308]|nr:hypothetical protein [Lachnospiraceae bacterium MD308]
MSENRAGNLFQSDRLYCWKSILTDFGEMAALFLKVQWGGYFGGQLLMVNFDDRRLEKSIMMEEQVIYMDKDRYAALKDGRINVCFLRR